jgi:hypothetical protein
MSNAGQWTPWTTGEGYTLQVGQSFDGEVHRKQPGGWWQASVNARALGSFKDLAQAFDRMEYEITTLMRLAMEDIVKFRPKRPS